MRNRGALTNALDHATVETSGPGRVPPPILRLRLLGHMRADDSTGRSVLPRTRKARAVLALASPQPVLRSQLTNLLRSQRESTQARASLRQALHELQDHLPASGSKLLIAERHHIVLHTDRIEMDVATSAPPEGGGSAFLDQFRVPLLEDLIGLDPAFDQWLVAERDRLVETARDAAERRLPRLAAHDERIELATSILESDPRRESV